VKLLLVAPEFPPAFGGMEIHADQMARALARRHDVTLMTPPAAAVPPGTGTHLPLLSRHYRRSLGAIRDVARRASPDAVLTFNAGYGELGAILDRPVIARVVGNDFLRAWIGPHLPGRFVFWRLPAGSEASPGAWLRRLDQSYRNRRVQEGLRNCRMILPNSRFTDEALTRCGVIGPARRVIQGGVDLERFQPGDRGAARARLGLGPGLILLTAARLERLKGIDVLLKALVAARKASDPVLLVIAGTGPEEEVLKKLAGELGLGGAVRFSGKVPHDLLPAYLAACDVYVQPSRVETMGRAVCEAAACARPAVVTRAGGLPEIVVDDETGMVVPEEDAAALSAALLRVLSDKALRERLGQAAADRARRLFGWETIARQTEDALEETRDRAAIRAR
jgi:glycosyltransferase involved in cell wall biosynthesis